MAKSFPNTGATVIDTVADLPAASGALEGVMMFQKDTNELKICDGASWISMLDTDTPPGLVHLNTTTISASTWTIDNIFSTTYRSYLLIFEYYATAANIVSMRLRTGGVASSTGYYMGGELTNYVTASGATVGNNNSAQWDARIGHPDTSSNSRGSTVMTLTDPAYAVNTTVNGSYVDARTNGSGGAFQGFHNVATAYDGFTFYGLTLTGVVSVYGYRN
jgi:hypothetical protein